MQRWAKAVPDMTSPTIQSVNVKSTIFVYV